MKKYCDKIILKFRTFAATTAGKRYINIVLGVIVFFIALWIIGLFRTPADFRVVRPVQGEQISQYLSNYIMPELYNKSQYKKPFDLVLSQTGINEILARHMDPNTLAKAGLSDLSASFKKDEIILTARTNYKGFNFVVSMAIEPEIDKHGKLFLDTEDFQLGRSVLPFVADVIKKKIIDSLNENFNAEKTGEFSSIILSAGRIDPVFEINHSKLRIEKITVQDQNLTLRFSSQ